MCSSHQGREPLVEVGRLRWASYANLCLVCVAEETQAIEADDEYNPSGYLNDRARSDLASSDAERIRLHSIWKTTQRKSFGRSIEVENVTDRGTGWLVGRLPWRSTDRHGDSQDQTVLCAFLDNDAPYSIERSNHLGFAAVEYNLRHGGYNLLQRMGAPRDQPNVLAQRIKALIAGTPYP
jgi:hypothetical protein